MLTAIIKAHFDGEHVVLDEPFNLQPDAPLHFGRVLTGSESGQSRPEKDIPEILRVLAEEKIDWRGFISHRGNLEEVGEISEQMRSGHAIHALVQMS
jgi:Zn-dependent alcohol dehydrogenase